MAFSHFHPVTQRWFSETLGEPTAAQLRGWDSIRERRHTLIAAPTGSGKTLAAFLTAVDDLFASREERLATAYRQRARKVAFQESHVGPQAPAAAQ